MLLQRPIVLSCLYTEFAWMWGGRNSPPGFKQQATLFILTESRSIKKEEPGRRRGAQQRAREGTKQGRKVRTGERTHLSWSLLIGADGSKQKMKVKIVSWRFIFRLHRKQRKVSIRLSVKSTNWLNLFSVLMLFVSSSQLLFWATEVVSQLLWYVLQRCFSC